jgi:hypothetical protein
VMLAQSFKSAADLGITEPQRDALMKTLVLLEAGKLTHVKDTMIFRPRSVARGFTGHFNMIWWGNEHPCGTVACIGGTAELVGGVTFDLTTSALDRLFWPPTHSDWGGITPAQAATALRSYLTTGDAKWHKAVA